jgi:hypothetical protein
MTIICENTDAVDIGTIENPDFEYQKSECEVSGFTDGSLVISLFLFTIIVFAIGKFFNDKFLGNKISKSRQ